MGEVYGNREDDNILVAAAKPVPSSPSEPKNTWAFDLQKQVQELTKVVSELRLQPKASQNHTPQSQQNTTRRKFRPQHDFSTPSQNQQSRRVQICYKCRAPGHISRFCNYNGQDQIDTNLKCQICNQFGHSAVQCYQFSSVNRRTPGDTGHTPPGNTGYVPGNEARRPSEIVIMYM